jgi:hypothetical protein
MGLVSFALAMIAALLLYLWPVQRPIDLRPLARWARQALGRPHLIRREEAPVSVAR